MRALLQIVIYVVVVLAIYEWHIGRPQNRVWLIKEAEFYPMVNSERIVVGHFAMHKELDIAPVDRFKARLSEVFKHQSLFSEFVWLLNIYVDNCIRENCFHVCLVPDFAFLELESHPRFVFGRLHFGLQFTMPSRSLSQLLKFQSHSQWNIHLNGRFGRNNAYPCSLIYPHSLLSHVNLCTSFPNSLKRVFMYGRYLTVENAGLYGHLLQLTSSSGSVYAGCNDRSYRRISYFLLSAVAAIILSVCCLYRILIKVNLSDNVFRVYLLVICFFACGIYGFGVFLDRFFNVLDCLQDASQEHSEFGNFVPHGNTVPQKYLLTRTNYWGTVIVIGRAQMANVLPMEKQVAVISALAEGSGIRQIERITGVHRDTIMRLGVRVGQGCAELLDSKMRDLPCRHLQFDEIWGFVGKKERHLLPEDNPTFGDVWTFCAIDSDTKLVPSFKVGKRDLATADAFVADVASRVKNRVQISADALRAYVDAIEMNFGADVDFAQIVKTYITDDSHIPERRFSAPEIVVTEKKRVAGFPDMRMASTSHVERLNGTTRLHMRRLTRLTYAFSKKLENFEAATALHFAYYNFVKRHNSIRCTPAMAAGVERDFWTVGELVKAVA